MGWDTFLMWPLVVAFGGPTWILDRFPRIDTAIINDQGPITALFVVMWIPFCLFFLIFGMCVWCPLAFSVMAIIGIFKLLWRLLKWVR